MSDDRTPDGDRGRRPQERREGGRPGGSPPGRPYGGKPAGGKPYGGGPAGAKPYGTKPGRGKPYGGKPYGAKAGGGKPYGGRPGGAKPYGSRPDGWQVGGHADAGRRDDRGSSSGAPDSAAGLGRAASPAPGQPPRTQGGPPRGDRQVGFERRERGYQPRPPRGPWEGDRGPRRPAAGEWQQRQRFTARPPVGPTAAEVLAEDEEVVAGRRPVEEAFAARREAKRLLVVPERRAALDQLVLHATTLRIPVVEVEGGTITAITGFDGHQGVALVVAPRRWATIDEVLARARARGEPPLLLALDHLEDPQNVGTLLRSAEACGVHGVLFPTRGAAPISPAAIKTSAGAVEHLLLVPLPDLAEGLVDLHARGLRVIGADGDAPLTVREVDMRGPIVIVTGSEGRGLNARVRKRVDLMARIPMRGRVASLNASVAGSVFLFEAASQRDLPEAVRPSPGSDEAETDASGADAAGAAAADAELAGEPGPAAGTAPATLAPETSTEADLDDEDLLPEGPPPAGQA